MKNNNDSFFSEAIDPRQEARDLALEVICRLLLWMGAAYKDGVAQENPAAKLDTLRRRESEQRLLRCFREMRFEIKQCGRLVVGDNDSIFGAARNGDKRSVLLYLYLGAGNGRQRPPG
jgi:hypothetical protein